MGGIIAFRARGREEWGGGGCLYIRIFFYLYLVFLFEMLELETIYYLTFGLRCVWVIYTSRRDGVASVCVIGGVVGRHVVWPIDRQI